MSETVRVIKCAGCHLRWLDDGRFERCPHCRRWTSIAAGEVRLTAVVAELEFEPSPRLSLGEPIDFPYREK